jgi:hypothetical protein
MPSIPIIRKITKIPEKIAKIVVFDKNIGVKDTVFLASMGRSGSTFLSNIINYDNRFRVMFEPFRASMVAEAKDFIYPYYIRPDNDDAGLLLSAQKIISGRVGSKWINRENRAVFPKARLIKEIRSNLFLKWLHSHFPEMKVVLLVRHPCAVAASWLSAGFADSREVRDRLLANRHFIADTDNTLIEEYQKANSDFERLVFLWCFSYHVPFRQFRRDELHTVFYENLILNPGAEIMNLFGFLGRKYAEEGIRDAYYKPSSTTKKSVFFFREQVRVDHWKNNCTLEQIASAYKIMELFGLGDLYDPDTSIPNIKTVAKKKIEKGNCGS